MKKDYLFKTEPFDHQRKVFYKSRNRESYALFMEQGTGKSKVIVDTAAWLYGKGKINAIFIIAPNGVHRNWVENEIPIHLPDYVDRQVRYWDSNRTNTKKFTNWVNEIFSDEIKLKIFTMNFEAVITKKGKIFIRQFLEHFKTFLVVDESHYIKNQKAKRTKAITFYGKLSKIRRILTGTPVTQNPLDLFTQFEFLDETILGFSSYYSFRNRYAILEKNKMTVETKKGKALVDYTTVIGFQNLEELNKKLAPHFYRVTKVECLDLPPKLYQTIYVELSKEQKRHYVNLRDQLLTQIEEEELTIAVALVKILRLQQVVGGFLPTDSGNIYQIEKSFPRLDRFLETIEVLQGKTIIWCKFTEEIKLLARTLKELYEQESTCLYYGEISQDDRVNAVERFQTDPKLKFFVGQPKSGGIGLNLTAGSNVVYYSNDYALGVRLQSEDRPHRIGQENKVTYIDLVCPGTIDEKVFQALRMKKNLADIITRDQIRDWI